ncbi:MAG: HlyD family type I secretion periplasmic adaptor subunit, partial [Burkholderiaceae bacterium]
KAGDVLVELDTTLSAADQERYSRELAAAQADILRARALLKAIDKGVSPRIAATPAIPGERLNEAQRLVTGQYQEYVSKRAQLSADIAHHEAELQSTQAAIRQLELTVPLAQQRAQDFKDLVDKNFISKHGWMEKEQTRLEQEGQLAIQKSRLNEIAASLQQSRFQRQSLDAETRRTTLDQLNDALRKQDVLQQELNKAQANNEAKTITAPVDGTVQQLAVHTVGGVVTAAQPLMIIVPRDNPVEVEAMLENKDIGFVRAGQTAAVKVETFPYTKYGTLPATVASVSEDAIQDEKRGLVYQTRIKLQRATIEVDGKTVRLSPGMAVTVEIKTGQRRVIEYFLSPLITHTSESLRER